MRVRFERCRRGVRNSNNFASHSFAIRGGGVSSGVGPHLPLPQQSPPRMARARSAGRAIRASA
eukprot:5277743-Pyramimonas_sp.AAC.1